MVFAKWVSSVSLTRGCFGIFPFKRFKISLNALKISTPKNQSFKIKAS
ncbi:hypothetical protein HPNQ4110_1153 [Helicobacter pylori NQ4110]|nr:hypothetical protein HPNQ4110_1153 [Helicobacter pylori NQ4110]